ncbi:MAG: GYD domain-containing protein [Acidobacteriaceae bacterium]|nr:GYD domain-containing protein [Acidobacteriaceae bacterium]MBV9503016.1 GYD domain-containing protein [Acidobacteriaceae bacterium]
MPTYIVMSKWTSQGLQNVKQSPSRLDAARKAYESAGIKMPHFWMVTGQYDMIAVLEAPDDVAVAKAILVSRSQGNFITETCRAFTEDEYKGIIDNLA